MQSPQYLRQKDKEQEEVQWGSARSIEFLLSHGHLAELDLWPSLFNKKKQNVFVHPWMAVADRMYLDCVTTRLTGGTVKEQFKKL